MTDLTQYIGVGEVTKITGASRAWVYERIKSGRFRSERAGRTILMPRAPLIDTIELEAADLERRAADLRRYAAALRN